MHDPRLSRRQFLQASGLGLAATCLPLPASSAEGEWNNWSGNQRARAAAVLFPRDEAELAAAMKTAQGPIRAFGGGHSFSALVPTDGTLVSLELMNGLVASDPQKLQATLRAGTRIGMAGELLAAAGQNLVNEPDINLQSLAGAISTATHGTGRKLPCLSACVTQLTLVLADGTVATCSAQRDRELFEAARVGLGSIGVISEITFQNIAAYRLVEHTQVMDLDEAMAYVGERRDIDRHVEFFAFPFGGKAIVKRMNFTTETETPVPESALDQNELLEFAAKTVMHAPFTKGVIQRLLGAFVSDERRVAPAHRMFPSPRTVQFNEMEYTVPAERGLDCLRDVVEVMRRKDLPVFFPVEFRYVAADDTWMSPFSQRAGASISVHQYYAQDYREVFAAVEPVFRRYEGRPHWGKVHSLAARDLHALYPRMDDFLAVRRRADPQGRLLNPYLRTLLGVGA